MNAPQRTLRLLAVIKDDTVRDHFLGLLEGVCDHPALAARAPEFTVTLDTLPFGSAEPGPRTIQYLTDYFSSHGNDAAVLLSDLLTQNLGTFPIPRCEPTRLAKDCYEQFRGHLYATIAVMGQPRRVLDIDRTVLPRPDGALLIAVLGLVMERLAYLARPVRTALANRVTIRMLTRNESELKRYFELRYRVYLPMGYLSYDTEQCASHMEMDWCDKKSIHIGAFEHVGVRENLVGTARVVTSEPIQWEHGKLFHDLAGDDPVLRCQLNTPLSLGLPVFDSQKGMNHLMAELLTGGEKSGELSRVTVAGPYRGAGLSGRLVTYAIAQAKRAGLTRLFLECLEIHQPLYAKLGFQRVPDMRGKVIGIDRTMIVMELPRSLLAGATVAVTETTVT